MELRSYEHSRIVLRFCKVWYWLRKSTVMKEYFKVSILHIYRELVRICVIHGRASKRKTFRRSTTVCSLDTKGRNRFLPCDDREIRTFLRLRYEGDNFQCATECNFRSQLSRKALRRLLGTLISYIGGDPSRARLTHEIFSRSTSTRNFVFFPSLRWASISPSTFPYSSERITLT